MRSRPTVGSEPTTAAGRALSTLAPELWRQRPVGEGHLPMESVQIEVREAIAAIEAEARATAEAQLAACNAAYEIVEKAGYTAMEEREQAEAQVAELRAALEVLVTKYVANRGTPSRFIVTRSFGRTTPTEEWDEAERALAAAPASSRQWPDDVTCPPLIEIRGQHVGGHPCDWCGETKTRGWCAIVKRTYCDTHKPHHHTHAEIEAHSLNQSRFRDIDAPTAADVLDWMKSRPGASWVASIHDVERAIAALDAK